MLYWNVKYFELMALRHEPSFVATVSHSDAPISVASSKWMHPIVRERERECLAADKDAANETSWWRMAKALETMTYSPPFFGCMFGCRTFKFYVEAEETNIHLSSDRNFTTCWMGHSCPAKITDTLLQQFKFRRLTFSLIVAKCEVNVSKCYFSHTA